MNYYERIDQSIYYIEDNLEHNISIDEVAKEAFMSISNFYRMFFALTGFTVKEYIRNRRFHLASKEILHGKKIIDVAFHYGFDSHEAFTRSFKKVTGITPNLIKKKKPFIFERMSVVDRYYEIQDKKLLEKYPDIKVLKELNPMKVAYYCYFGTDPEKHAWSVISDWLNRSGLNIEKDKLRIFGFNNPSPGPTDTEYGYEIWVTISDEMEINDNRIKTKTFPGGLYAITSVKGGVESIYPTWQRLSKWLSDSKYTYGGHQWLEEHLQFDDRFNHLGGLDLYIPIEPRDQMEQKECMNVSSMKLMCYKEVGKDAVNKARKFFVNWLNEHNRKNAKVISWYNFEKAGSKDYYCIIDIEVENDEVIDERFKLIDFTGGKYLTVKTKFKRLGYEWNVFIKWMETNKNYQFGKHQFFEEITLNNGKMEMESDTNLYMPVV